MITKYFKGLIIASGLLFSIPVSAQLLQSPPITYSGGGSGGGGGGSCTGSFCAASAPLAVNLGGNGLDNSGATGIPLYTAGTQSILSTSGTGNVIRSASPTFTGTVTASAATLSGTLTTNLTGGGTQCVQASNTGVLSGTGSACGAGGGGSPGGSNTQVQYNNSGSFGGISGLTTNGTVVTFADGAVNLTGLTSGTSILKAPATGGGTVTLPSGTTTIAAASNNLSFFASTTSAQLLGVLSDETGTGSAVFSASPTFTGTVSAATLTLSGQFTTNIAGGGTQCLQTDTFGAVTGIGTGCNTVSSVFGRTGTVSAATNDYNFNQLAGTAAPGQLPVATTSAFGAVKPDGSTITISGGVISSTGGSAVSVTAGTPNIVITPSPGTGTFTVGTIGADSPNSSTSTSYTFQASDVGYILHRKATSAQTDTIPTVATTGFGAGYVQQVCSGPNANQSQDTISVAGGASQISYGGTALVSSIIIPSGSCVTFLSDGNAYSVFGLPQIRAGSTIIANSTSGASLYDNAGKTDELAKVNGSVLSRTSGGTLQESATLPSGIAATSMALTTPDIGTPSAGNASNLTNIPVANATGVLLATNGGTGLSALGTGVATALGANVSGSGGICLSSGSSCAAGTGGGMFNYSDSGVTLTANTYYVSIGGGGAPSTTLADVSIPSPSVTTVNNLSVSISTTLGGASTLFTVTLWKNGATTALTCNFNPSSLKACTDNNAGHSVSIAQGDTLAWQIITTGTIIGTPVVNISANNGTTNAVGVTSIATNNGVTGGTITGTGTIGLAAAAADTYKGNATSGSAVPTDVAQINCPIKGEGYNTSTHTMVCATPPVWQSIVSGNYYPFNPQMASTLQGATVLATVIYWTPIYISQPLFFQKLCTRATVADASNNFQLALYASSASNLITGAPLVSTGNIALSTAPANLCGTASYSVTTPGLYWFGMATNSTTEKFYAYATGTPVLGSVGTATLANMAQGTTTPLFGLGWTTTGVSWAAQVFSGWPTSPTLVEAQAATSQTTVPFFQAN